MSALAPLHLLKIEFKLEEVLFLGLLNDIIKELTCQQTALDNGEEISRLTARSQEYFKNGKTVKGFLRKNFFFLFLN